MAISERLALQIDRRFDAGVLSNDNSRNVTDRVGYPRNARTHSRKQIRQIAKSIERFGFCNPVLVDDGGQIIAGHGRVEAAKLLDMKELPTVRLSHLSDAEKRAYILADNRLAERSGWDREILAIELQNLIEVGFDVDLTGFETADIDLLLEDQHHNIHGAPYA